jgi:hypothetical protein
VNKKERGILRKSRGVISVLSRSKLEHQACEYYAYLRRHFERLLPGIYPFDEPMPHRSA